MKVNPKNNSRLSRRHFLRGLGAVAAGLTFFPREGWSAEEKSSTFTIGIPISARRPWMISEMQVELK